MNLDNFTPEQLQTIKDAAYMISDARSKLSYLLDEIRASGMSQVPAGRAVCAALRDTTKLTDGTSMDWMYRQL